MRDTREFEPCKWCGGEPKHNMYGVIFHQYICYCLHRTSTDELTSAAAKRQWNAQNSLSSNRAALQQ